MLDVRLCACTRVRGSSQVRLLGLQKSSVYRIDHEPLMMHYSSYIDHLKQKYEIVRDALN